MWLADCRARPSRPSPSARPAAFSCAERQGAIASREVEAFGTIEPGKEADLVVLDGDPLADIHNIRKVVAVLKGGTVVDRNTLPQKRVLSRAPATTSNQ